MLPTSHPEMTMVTGGQVLGGFAIVDHVGVDPGVPGALSSGLGHWPGP